MNRRRYEVKEIDAWLGSDDEWYWNDVYYLGMLTTTAGTKQGLKKALNMFLINHSRILNSCDICYYYDGDILEIHERFTDRPLFAMIPLF